MQNNQNTSTTEENKTVVNQGQIVPNVAAPTTEAVEEQKTKEEAEAAAKAKEEESTKNNITAVDASEVENYGVYNGMHLVKTFNPNTHGENFKELAENFAKRKGGGYTVKEYVIPGDEPEYSKDSVVVYTRNKQVFRVYSLETHGKDYKKLAKQFVDKYAEKKGYQL